MNILMLSKYGHLGASSRYRSYQYIPIFENHGIKVTSAPLLDDKYLRRLYLGKKVSLIDVCYSYSKRLYKMLQSSKYDLVWIEKEALPWMPAWLELLFINSRIPYIVDYDDAIFHNYDLHRRSIVRTLLGNKIAKVMKHSNLVIAGNHYLADYALRAGSKNVIIIPTVVDLKKYPSNCLYEETDLVKIGWIGTPSTEKYIRSISPLLDRLCKKYNAQVSLIGASCRTEWPDTFEIIKWTESTEINEIRKFDIGIMPLIDAPWERGKCGLKLIQYMGCFLPVVASPVGVNCEIVEQGINGYTASTNKDWETFLSLLLENQELRLRMGAAGRKKVEQNYSLDVTSNKIVDHLIRINNEHKKQKFLG